MIFTVGYSDPAWLYNVWNENSNVGGVAAQHYDVMNYKQMVALPVKEVFKENSIMFMWVTWPQLEDGIKLLKHWGFEYKTVAFVWVKTYKSGGYFFGNGHYTRANSEVVILGTRGSSVVYDHGISQIIETEFTPPIQVTSPIEGHSKKPDSIRDKIVQLIGNVPRLELFARQKTPGWNVLGNEIDGKNLDQALNEIITKGCKIESEKPIQEKRDWWV